MVMGTNIIKIKFKKINEIKVLPFFFFGLYDCFSEYEMSRG